MEIETSIEQVAGILFRDGLEFQTREDGRSYQLMAGSAAVFIDFDAADDGSVVITVYSPVLQDVDPRVPESAEGLGLLNTLNRAHSFTKFTFADNALFAEYDLLGDTLHADELRYAIRTIAEAADRLDDELVRHIGGRRFVTAMQQWMQPPPEGE